MELGGERGRGGWPEGSIELLLLLVFVLVLGWLVGLASWGENG